ncbi:MAG: sulfatase-like hydrolase/transferase [Vicinamibacterales bacterium]
MPLVATVVARIAVTAFCGITCLYALVASSTFAYLQFLKPRVFAWTGTLADWHAMLAWPALAALMLALWPDLRCASQRRAVATGLWGLCAAAVAGAAHTPLLPGLANDSRSLWVALASLAPLLVLALLDQWRFSSAIARIAAEAPPVADGRLLRSAVLAAASLTLASAVLAALRASGRFEPDLRVVGFVYGVWRSLASHLVVWTAVFLCGALTTHAVAGRRGMAWWIWSGLLAAVTAMLFDRSVGNVLSLPPGFRVAISLAVGVSIVGTWAGVQLMRYGADVHLRDPLAVYFGRPRPVPRVRWLLAVILSGVALWGAQMISAQADWDDLNLRLGTMVVWAVVLAWAYRRTPAQSAMPTATLLVTVLVPLAIWPLSSSSGSARRALARYEVYDPSYRLARGIGVGDGSADGSFYRYLRAHTGLTDVAVAPREIDFVQPLAPVADPPPVFLLVVDSLRRDYVGAYNPQAFFTPNIDALAADSVVFRNAFTRYGGTGLSVPAIWAGAALPHKQYVIPFHPMNTLEKLLEANGYRRFVSLDSIMVRLLQRSPQLEELDRGVAIMDYELCRTLGELEGKLSSAPRGAPIFAYSLPQDIHMSRLSQWTAPDGDFRGFFPPYAGRIQAMDRCVGRFVMALKRLGLYEESVIVLTSDHGEMLGEDGQFGHSYHLVPPVVQVPLIVHLPAAQRDRGGIDPDAVALSTDITPTIYAALGYHPSAPSLGPLAGRPLIGQQVDGIEQRRRGVYVLAASYGAVYAVVRENGRRLYVADGVKASDRVYVRDERGRWVEQPVGADERAIQQFAIRQHIDRVSHVYDVPGRD